MLDRKLNDQNKLKMNMKECTPQQFYKRICKHFLYLNGKNVLQPKVLEIIADLLKWGKENYVELRNNFSQYKDIFQYVHSNAFREIYCSTERRGFNLKSTFHIILKACKDKKNIECLGKNLQNYENVHNETSVYEPKPIKRWF